MLFKRRVEYSSLLFDKKLTKVSMIVFGNGVSEDKHKSLPPLQRIMENDSFLRNSKNANP